MIRQMVLIHGAWQGSWAFGAWQPELARRGWDSHALDLPGNGWPPAADAPASLQAYTRSVLDVLEQFDAPVVLVGHSGGGITASQVAEAAPERVSALVYLAGMMLPSGLGFLDIVRRCAVERPGLALDGIAPYLEHSADGATTRVTIDGALKIFVHDCEPVAARRAAELLRPQQESGRAMKPLLTAERYGRVPRVYVECSEDRSVLLPLQEKMQQLSPGAIRIPMRCGHVPQLAEPVQLADRLCAELEALGA